MHRNSQKRIIEPIGIYFITTNTYERFPFFRATIFCELFIEELKVCKKVKDFELYAFCVLYDHIHLLLKPNEHENISKIMKFLKENFSRDANKIIVGNITEGDTAPCRLHIQSVLKILSHQFLSFTQSHRFEIPEFKWQKSFHDHIIRNEKDFEYHWNYTSYNFDKHHEDGYPDDYQYTSLNYEDMVDSVDF